MNYKKDTPPLNKCCTSMINDGLYLPNRQLSGLLAILIFIFFAFFMVGYFCGKRHAVQQFIAHEYQQKSVGEQTSLESSLDVYAEVENDELVACTENHHSVSEHDLQPVDNGQDTCSSEKFYAKLIGFGTEKAAHAFVAKLSKQNIIAHVKKHTSKTAQGRTLYWYQVVTDTYDDKKELTALVEKITEQEKLRDVVMSTC